MDLRYTLLALANLLAGAFLVTATFGFDVATAVNVGFGVSIAVLVIALAMAYFGFTGIRAGERIGLGLLGLATATLASWTIVATTGIFDDESARWLVFSSGLGHVALSVAGIVTHEAVVGKKPARRRRR